MRIHSKFKIVSIKNIILDGRYSLVNECSHNSCRYCPYVSAYDSSSGVLYFDDRNKTILNIENYATNCDDFHDINFITIDYNTSLFLEFLDVHYFQQQYSSFISSQGTIVNLTSVNFDRVQSNVNKA